MKKNEMPLAKIIGSLIRKEREQQGLSQQQLADKLGEHHTRISFIERGCALPSIPTLLALCNVLNVAPEKILALSIESVDLEALKPSPRKLKEATRIVRERTALDGGNSQVGRQIMNGNSSVDLPSFDEAGNIDLDEIERANPPFKPSPTRNLKDAGKNLN